MMLGRMVPCPLGMGSGVRALSTLNALRPLPGSRTKNTKRLGRGCGSGKGKTSGKGHKGQRARSGPPRVGFEGGQTPGWKHRDGKSRGFHNPFSLDYQEVNLSKVQDFIDQGRLPVDRTITCYDMAACGLISRLAYPGVKLLGEGKTTFNAPVNLMVNRATKGAAEAVRRAGGEVVEKYMPARAFLKLRQTSSFQEVQQLLEREYLLPLKIGARREQARQREADAGKRWIER